MCVFRAGRSDPFPPPPPLGLIIPSPVFSSVASPQGLNVFNTALTLADPKSATDSDYERVSDRIPLLMRENRPLRNARPRESSRVACLHSIVVPSRSSPSSATSTSTIGRATA